MSASRPPLSLLWTEHNAGSGAKPSSNGFGTDVVTRMLPYELKTDTGLAIGPESLRCTISFPLP